VLAMAIGAGREIDHRGPLAVKRRGNLNAKPRAAASASAEGKTRAAVVGIVKLGDAGRTDSEVRGDEHAAGCTGAVVRLRDHRGAGPDRERGEPLDRSWFRIDRKQYGRGRNLVLEPVAEVRKLLAEPLDVDQHPLRRVLDP